MANKFRKVIFQQESIMTSEICAPGQRNLECLVAGYKGGQLGKRLLARTANADKQSVSARCVEDSGDPEKIVNSLVEKDQIQAFAADALVVLAHEHLEPRFQAFPGTDLAAKE